eukprot:Pompholyxophrys_punicea_v1_NODE_222_length_2701_cov_12.239229.p3 type:complete len:158 gc:universal NODE_222_length_2701_cov_12.239229:2267-1794(-)
MGFQHLLRPTNDKKPFCLWRLCVKQGWKSKCTFGDRNKLPTDWSTRVKNFMLRIAYFVFLHDIPKELIVNYDHTPCHFVQMKGATRQTGNEAQKGTIGKGDKRQFTLVLGTSATGKVLPAQIIVEGKTSKCLPTIGKFEDAPGPVTCGADQSQRERS